MSVAQIVEQLDELASLTAPDIDAGREPDPEKMEQYAELLGTFLTEHPSDAVSWLREVYAR